MNDRLDFLAFSDWHVHEFSFGANNTTDLFGMRGLNSRLVDAGMQFVEMVTYAHEHDINYILFGGDLYHSKKMISKDALNVVFACFEWAHENYPEIQFVLIYGNHDVVDKDGTINSLSSLWALPNVLLIDKINPVVYLRGHFNVFMHIRGVSYTENRAALIEDMNNNDPCDLLTGYGYPLDPVPSINRPTMIHTILLIHSGIQGAKVGTDFVLVKDHDLSVTDIPREKYDIVLGGHLHEHQQVFDNGWIIGATHQMNWSDAGGKRGFIHVSITNDKVINVEHIPTSESLPRFHELTSSDLTGVRPRDFVKYHVDEPISEELLKTVQGYMLANIGGIPAYLELIPPAVTEEEFELSEKAVSADTILEEWVASKANTLDKETLTALGKELLLEARQKLE
jgi:DNA repair exonuclease SbcCD nuclease subunit